jgi:hypothetical protein
VQWEDENGNQVYGSGIFAGGTVYRAVVRLVTLGGYTLLGVPANSFTHYGATTITNDADAGMVSPGGGSPYGTVTITFPATTAGYSVTDVTVTPSSPTVDQGGKVNFSATVTGSPVTPPQNVNWSVSGNTTMATYIANGVLTVAANETGSLTVRATSVADPTQYYEAQVTVNPVVYTEIGTIEELKAISSGLSGKYKLTANLELTDWTPIGSSAGTAFSGVFDGNGKTITLKSFASTALSTNYLGIFGYVKGVSADSQAVLKNLNIASEVTGTAFSGNTDKYAGPLIAYAENAEISGIAVSGNFALSAPRNIVCGGIVGYSKGTSAAIEGCSFTGNITATSDATTGYAGTAGGIAGETGTSTVLITGCRAGGVVSVAGISTHANALPQAGGIAGKNVGTIARSYFIGEVKADSSAAKARAGGIVGSNSATDPIEDCWSHGQVKSVNAAGGIIGYGFGSARRCYSTASVICTGSTDNNYTGTGGIVGGSGASGINITGCASLNSAISRGGGAYIHRVLGYSGSPTITNTYAWSGMTVTPGSGTYTPDEGADKRDGAGVTAAQLTQTFYEGLEWDFTPDSGVWAMDDNGYPKLQWQTEEISRSPLT